MFRQVVVCIVCKGHHMEPLEELEIAFRIFVDKERIV